jgi:hypothetical protein
VTPRRAIADHFAAELGSAWHVQGYPNEPDTLAKPTLMVYTERIAKARMAAGAYQATLVLFVAVPQQKQPIAEDALDDALTTVLDVLEAYDALTWDEVERSTLAEKFHGYRIPATAAYTTTQE